MSMTISRNSTGINGLKDLLHKLLIPQEVMRQHQDSFDDEYFYAFSVFFLKRFFSKLWWLYSCLKLQKTRPDYYFNNIELIIVIIDICSFN